WPAKLTGAVVSSWSAFINRPTVAVPPAAIGEATAVAVRSMIVSALPTFWAPRFRPGRLSKSKVPKGTPMRFPRPGEVVPAESDANRSHPAATWNVVPGRPSAGPSAAATAATTPQITARLIDRGFIGCVPLVLSDLRTRNSVEDSGSVPRD